MLHCKKVISHSQQKCNTWHNLDVKQCNICHQEFDSKWIQSEIEWVHSKDEQRLCDIFERGCNDHNTAQENLYLLLYGFIRSQIVSDMHIPEDIIELCAGFVYDVKKMREKIADKFSSWKIGGFAYDENCAEISEQSTIVKWTNHDYFTTNIVYGCHSIALISTEFIRREWKLKILTCDENEPVDFQVGLVPLIDKWTNKLKHPEKVIIGKRFTSDDVKEGDVITMICTYRQKVSFRINGDLIDIKDIAKKHSLFSVYLGVQIDCNITLQILQH